MSQSDSEYSDLSLVQPRKIDFNVEGLDTSFGNVPFDEILFSRSVQAVLSGLRHNKTNMANQESRAKNWCFTTNNYTDDHVAKLREGFYNGSFTYVVFGYEVGDSGTPHLQGFASLPVRKRFSEVVLLIADSHLSVTRKIQNAITYCKKEGNFEELGTPPSGPGNRSDLEAFKAAVKEGTTDVKTLRDEHSEVCARFPRFVSEYIRDHMVLPALAMHPLLPWQATLNHDLSLPPDDRKIIFIVDAKGNNGKSWFAKYYCSLHDNAQLILPCKKADMAYCLRLGIRVLFLDAPRSKQGDFIQYDFLEELKNGFVMSNKYESYVKLYDKLHVVVLMNEQPDPTKLSQDRYDIRVLN